MKKLIFLIPIILFHSSAFGTNSVENLEIENISALSGKSEESSSNFYFMDGSNFLFFDGTDFYFID